MMKLIPFAGLMFIQLNFFPNVSLLAVLFLVMVFDFITGVLKAKVLGMARTSDGFRKTIKKFTQYAFALLASYSLAYVANTKGGETIQHLTPYLVDGLSIFIVYIEITSIFENLYMIDSDSMISKYFFAPMLKMLTFQIKNNPVIKSAEQVEEEN